MGAFTVTRHTTRKGRARTASVALALLALGGTPLVWASPAQAQIGRSALADPATNVPRTAAMNQTCSLETAPACQLAVVRGIDQARAAEGVRALTLPSDYDRLSTAAQLLVLTESERVDRGLPGFTGLSAELDGLAEKGAISNADPIGPAGQAWGSNWAGGEGSALLADYDWMYDDGLGSPNLDCTSAAASGCWDHRRNIVGDYGPHPSMGAAATTVKGVTSVTELLSSAPAEATPQA